MKATESLLSKPERQILMLLQQHIVGAQFTGTVYGTEVTTTQAAVIGEIVRRKTPSIEELSSLLGVHPSTISRTCAQLNAMGLIESEQSRHDNRRVEHRCTPKGLEFVDLMWTTVEGLIQKRLQYLSAAEREELESFLEVFAGQDAIARIVRLPHDSNFGVLWRALTYAHGVASSDYVGSGHSPTDWVTLSEIKYRRRAPNELATLMRVPRSTISVRLRALEKAGLIRAEKHEVDKRRRLLALTAQGEEVLAHIERCAEALFRRNLKQLSPSKMQRGIDFLKRYVEALYPRTDVVPPRVTWISEAELPGFRKRAWVQRPRAQSTYPLSGYFFHRKNIVLSFESDGGAQLLLEFAETPHGSAALINCISLGNAKPALPVEGIVALVEKELGRTVEVSDEWREQLRYV